MELKNSKTIKFGEFNCNISISSYKSQTKKHLFKIQLYDKKDGFPVATATKYDLDFERTFLQETDVYKFHKNICLIKDYSENSGILDVLLNANVIKYISDYNGLKVCSIID